MRSLWSRLFFLSTWLVGSAAQAASDPGVSVSVVPVPSSVTLSRAAQDGESLNTFAAYRINLRNGASSDLRAYFKATATNVGGTEPLAFTTALPAGAACTGLGTASVDCQFGTLAPGSEQQLLLVVRAPSNGSRIDISYEAGGDEGKGGSNGCCSIVGTASTGLVDPTTNTDYRRQLSSFVTPDGGSFFTGDAAVTTSADGWTTRVVVPSFSGDSVASIQEQQLATSCAPYAVANGCFRTELSLPGSFPGLLKIFFRWDKSLYNLGKPELAKLYYRKLATDTPFALQLCTASGPAAGVPCLARAPRKLSNQDTANKELWGDLLFEVLALDNGVYEN